MPGLPHSARARSLPFPRCYLPQEARAGQAEAESRAAEAAKLGAARRLKEAEARAESLEGLAGELRAELERQVGLWYWQRLLQLVMNTQCSSSRHLAGSVEPQVGGWQCSHARSATAGTSLPRPGASFHAAHSCRQTQGRLRNSILSRLPA